LSKKQKGAKPYRFQEVRLRMNQLLKLEKPNHAMLKRAIRDGKVKAVIEKAK